MTKQEKKEYMKTYRQVNKEKLSAYNKAYSKTWRANLKDGLYTVYLIVRENYVGYTTTLHERLSKHRNKYNRDISDVYIIGKYKTKKEALDVERKYHKMGYEGRNAGEFKPQTNIAGVDFTESLNNLNNLL